MKLVFKSAFVLGVTVLSWFSVQAAVIAIVAIILVALHERAGMLIEVSFGPLRAKLEREVTEAEKLIGKLREFAALQAKAVLTASIRTGRFSDSSDWAYQSLTEMEAKLRELGVGEDALREARSEFIRFTISDLGNSAMGVGRVPMHLGQEAINDWQEISRKGLQKTPGEIEDFLRKWGELTQERQLRIEEMRWVMEHQDIRDREQYLLAQDPVEWGAV